MSGSLAAILALGNPGGKHAGDRHNAGFWLADALAKRWQLEWTTQRRFKSALTRYSPGDGSIWLAKPQTYMNASGEAAAALCRFYRIPAERTLIVHDDLDLAPGAARFKAGGGHGGHNGLRDVARTLGVNTKRLRLGIGRPDASAAVISYVLSAPSATERRALDGAVERAVEAIEVFAARGWERAAEHLNSQRLETS